MNIITVDAMGEQCPIPVIKTKKALMEIKEPCTVQVHVDNTTAEQNILRLATSYQIDARSVKMEHKHYVVTLHVRSVISKDAADAPQASAEPCAPCAKTVVAIGSSTMGQGNEELGGVLMKGFLYALSHSEHLPDTVVFYNGGAKLTVEGAASLEDLRDMESHGVAIYTCGTCLDYYGIKDKLAVGKITNMYQIVELLDGADKVIRP